MKSSKDNSKLEKESINPPTIYILARRIMLFKINLVG